MRGNRETLIRLSGIVRESFVDGPGIRYTVFTQGCPHHCPGCHNPGTHAFDGGTLYSVGQLIDDIQKNPLLRGVTLSGGEPFVQAEALCELAVSVRLLGLDLVVFSGYTFQQLLEGAEDNPAWGNLLRLCDILIDGRYEQSQRDLTLKFRGSRNQRIIDLKESLSRRQAVEIVL